MVVNTSLLSPMSSRNSVYIYQYHHRHRDFKYTLPCLINIYPEDANSGPHTYTESTEQLQQLFPEQFPQTLSILEEQILPGMVACAVISALEGSEVQKTLQTAPCTCVANDKISLLTVFSQRILIPERNRGRPPKRRAPRNWWS